MTLQETLFYAAVACFIVAGLCIVVAAIIFFMKDIRGVRNYLTGKTIREAIERGSSGSGKTRRRTSAGAKTGTGNLSAGKIPGTGSLEAQSGPIRHASTVTPAHSRQAAIAQERQDAADSGGTQAGPSAFDEPGGVEATTILDEGADATSVLSEASGALDSADDGANATTILEDGADSMTILKDGVYATTVLDEAGQLQELEQHDAQERQQEAPSDFTVVRRIVLTECKSIVRAD